MSDLHTRWYKDRDFPEVKASNADIVAVIPRPEHLDRVIREQNALVEENGKIRSAMYKMEEELQRRNDTNQSMFRAIEMQQATIREQELTLDGYKKAIAAATEAAAKDVHPEHGPDAEDGFWSPGWEFRLGFVTPQASKPEPEKKPKFTELRGILLGSDQFPGQRAEILDRLLHLFRYQYMTLGFYGTDYNYQEKILYPDNISRTGIELDLGHDAKDSNAKVKDAFDMARC